MISTSIELIQICFYPGQAAKGRIENLFLEAENAVSRTKVSVDELPEIVSQALIFYFT